GIVHGQDLLRGVGDHNQLVPLFGALLGAFFGTGVCSFNATVRVGHPATNGLTLSRLRAGRRNRDIEEHETEGQPNRQQFLHRDLSSSMAAARQNGFHCPPRHWQETLFRTEWLQLIRLARAPDLYPPQPYLLAAFV